VIDVAGHGVSAAMLSVTLSHWLEPTRGRSPLVTPNPDTPDEPWITAPALVAERLSTQFPFDTRTAQYFTMLYGVLDTQAGTFRFVSAGHPSPLHVPQLGGASYAEASGFPIGLVPEPRYEESLLRLAPGDRLFLYSDGLVDGEDETGHELGRDGLRREVEAVRGLGLAAAVPALLAAVDGRLGEAGQRDDLTLLALELT
jgi:sigma-B regulation protein RsbU (phosphoserine phosphatase)